MKYFISCILNIQKTIRSSLNSEDQFIQINHSDWSAD